jgi:hypothetical protein
MVAPGDVVTCAVCIACATAMVRRMDAERLDTMEPIAPPGPLARAPDTATEVCAVATSCAMVAPGDVVTCAVCIACATAMVRRMDAERLDTMEPVAPPGPSTRASDIATAECSRRAMWHGSAR